jgi:hypothetical protein
MRIAKTITPKTTTPKTTTRHENRRYRVRLIDVHIVCAEVDLSIPVPELVDLGPGAFGRIHDVGFVPVHGLAAGSNLTVGAGDQD